MDRKTSNASTPTCLFSHTLLNKLSVIIGSCDIALEQLKTDSTPESQVGRRVTVVREIAWELVDELKDHQCLLDGVTKTALMLELSRHRRLQGETKLVRAFDEKRDPLKAHR